VADSLIELPGGITLRAVDPSDRDFLLALYGDTRVKELAVVPWTAAEKAAFLEMQFSAQDADYRRVYPDGEFLLVTDGSRPIGRLYLGRVADELRIVDIALVPERRGQGIGSTLMRWVLERADRDGLAVSLHVEALNPAKRLYERLGFETIEVRGPYEFMRRPSASQLKTAS
jgi:ribosomal protein S18 acetylase RimI-like enzyme